MVDSRQGSHIVRQTIGFSGLFAYYLFTLFLYLRADDGLVDMLRRT